MPYHHVWNACRDLTQARRIIYNAEDEATFDEGGRLDADLIRPYLTSGMDVLDVGCGIGRIETFLAPDCGTLTGIDISGQMICEARRRLADHANVTLTRNNGKDLSLFPDNCFDLAFSFFVLQHLEKEDAFRYLQEIARVLRPGGTAILQFPLLASGYFDQSFLPNVTTGGPYHVARPRLYTTPEACFLLARAGLSPLHFIHRGDEAVFVLANAGPDRASVRRMAQMPDPAPMRLYAHVHPSPPAARDSLMGLAEFQSAAKRAASSQPGAAVVDEGESGIVLTSKDEFVVPFGNGEWRDVILSVAFEILAPPIENAYPDLSIGIRSTTSPDGISGPYVQTDSGNPFMMRTRDGDAWEGLPAFVYTSVKPSPEPMTLSLLADGPVLALYGADGIAGIAMPSSENGRMYLRIVATSIHIRRLRVERI